MEQGMEQGLKKALEKVLKQALKKALNRALNKVEKRKFSRGKFKSIKKYDNLVYTWNELLRQV